MSNELEKRELSEVVDESDDSQDWAGMDGAIAWHLIDRHADGWQDVGRMMSEWLSANQSQQVEGVPDAPKPAGGES